jgi:hypothetical protein
MPDRSYPNIFSQGRPLRYTFGGKLLGGELQRQVRDENRPRRGKESRAEVGNLPITGGTLDALDALEADFKAARANTLRTGNAPMPSSKSTTGADER